MLNQKTILKFRPNKRLYFTTVFIWDQEFNFWKNNIKTLKINKYPKIENQQILTNLSSLENEKKIKKNTEKFKKNKIPWLGLVFVFILYLVSDNLSLGDEL